MEMTRDQASKLKILWENQEHVGAELIRLDAELDKKQDKLVFISRLLNFLRKYHE